MLQGKLPGVEAAAVADVQERAVNRDPSLVPETVFTEALGEYCHR